MTICGIKLTHDSTIAVIENGRLQLSLELEKLSNNNRYKILEDVTMIPQILGDHGYDVHSIDQFVIDGWTGLENSSIRTKDNRSDILLSVAPYHENNIYDSILKSYPFNSLKLDNKCISYNSYTHVAGHVMSAYCTSPFGKDQEDTLVLIWDGGMFPRLYIVRGEKFTVENLGPIFYMGVNVYSMFAQHFGPFRINENVIKDELSIAGKVMAYIACGEVVDEIVTDLYAIYNQNIQEASKFCNIPNFPYTFANQFRAFTKNKGYSDENILTSFHYFLEKLLISSLKERMRCLNLSVRNLCFGGGAALNIKWNSALRRSGLFESVWVCPFPNDAGSAIGAACCEMFVEQKIRSLDWNVYQGPKIIHNELPAEWDSKPCSVNELAKLLHDSGEPVIFLNDRAELGPRALGNRSIIASPTCGNTKNILNWIKYREHYRPVAPLCLEEDAPTIFEPGCPDPYMLYDHNIRKEWLNKIPAVGHLDGSARLQTVSRQSNPCMYELLTEYKKITGIPVLCNTSANYKGSGFFPDTLSASKWGKVNYIWCENMLYEKAEKNKFNLF